LTRPSNIGRWHVARSKSTRIWSFARETLPQRRDCRLWRLQSRRQSSRLRQHRHCRELKTGDDGDAGYAKKDIEDGKNKDGVADGKDGVGKNKDNDGDGKIKDNDDDDDDDDDDLPMVIEAAIIDEDEGDDDQAIDERTWYWRACLCLLLLLILTVFCALLFYIFMGGDDGVVVVTSFIAPAVLPPTGACLSNPCLNYGACFASPTRPSKFVCTCRTGFSGKDCSKPDPCATDDPCKPNGKCVKDDEHESYSCI